MSSPTFSRTDFTSVYSGQAARERSQDDVPADGGHPHLVPVQDPRL